MCIPLIETPQNEWMKKEEKKPWVKKNLIE
jgi:hypothetical protein